MSPIRITGVVLVLIGIVALVWGGVFWTDTDTIIDAGPVELATQDREGFALPPVLGIVSLVAGILLLVLPRRKRV